MEPLTTDDPAQIGPYRLLARLGAGGMGQVFLGRTPTRHVAVKVIQGSIAGDTSFRERFARETTLARKVSGPYTAAVIDADPHAAQPWLATEFVAGPSLHDAVRRSGPFPEDTVRFLAAGLCEALDAVHRAGIVHRDLKPSNILLASDGPRLIDFGIAKAVHETSLTPLTPTGGGIMGTPSYMSPEQVVNRDITPRSDMFALGGVLYHAATGHPPFGGTDPALFHRILETHPDLDAVPSGVRDLVSACLEKHPEHRPSPAELLNRIGDLDLGRRHWLPASVHGLIATVQERVDDITLALTRPEPQAGGEPTTERISPPTTGRAASPTAPSRPRSPSRGEGSGKAAGRPAAPRPESTAPPPPTSGPGRPSSPQREAAPPASGSAAPPFPGTAAPPAPRPHGTVRRRRGLSSAALVLVLAVLLAPFAACGALLSLRSLSDSSAAGGSAGENVPETVSLEHDAPVREVRFSPDGSRLATATENGAIHLWDAGSWERTGTIVPGGESVEGFVFSPDGSQLVTTGASARLWDVESGEQVASFSHRKDVQLAVFSPDGSRLATRGAVTVRVWDVATGGELFSEEELPSALLFSPDGSRLLTADSHQTKLWDVTTGEEVGVLSPEQHLSSGRAVLSPDGSLLATSGTTGAFHLWDTETWEEIAVFDHGGRDVSTTFSSDGSLLASHDETSHTVRVWDTDTRQQVSSVELSAAATSAAFVPDSSLLAVAEGDRPEIRVWDVSAATATEHAVLTGHEGPVRTVVSSSGDSMLVSGGEDSTVRVWSLP